jgi:hypothetical protein
MDRYNALLRSVEAGDVGAQPTDVGRLFRPGTFGALVHDYLASAAFNEKAESTKEIYRASSMS